MKTFSTTPAFCKLNGKIKYYSEKKLSQRSPCRSHFFPDCVYEGSKVTQVVTVLDLLMLVKCDLESRRTEKACGDLTKKHSRMCHSGGRFQGSMMADTHLAVLRLLSHFHTCPVTNPQKRSMRPCLWLLSCSFPILSSPACTISK